VTERWLPGEQKLHRFLMHGKVIDARPVTVVADDDDTLVLWLAHGTMTTCACLPGGVDLRSVSKEEMFGRPWHTKRHLWRNGVLMVLPRGAEFAVWHFFTPDGEFTRWYGNLQTPYGRWARGVDVVDHQLDLVVSPDRDVVWKDIDELAAAVDAGWFTPAESDAIHAAAGRLAAMAEAGEPPFDGRWCDFRPDPDWPLPALPDDWATPAPQTQPSRAT
jgi:protein associated with RNAse G/E